MRSAVIGTIACAALVTAVVAAPRLTTLPTGWRFAAPERGRDRRNAAAGIVVSRDGSRVIELEAGYRKPVLRVLDAATLTEMRSVALTARTARRCAIPTATACG